jgi:hypothetical protein
MFVWEYDATELLILTLNQEAFSRANQCKYPQSGFSGTRLYRDSKHGRKQDERRSQVDGNRSRQCGSSLMINACRDFDLGIESEDQGRAPI